MSKSLRKLICKELQSITLEFRGSKLPKKDLLLLEKKIWDAANKDESIYSDISYEVLGYISKGTSIENICADLEKGKRGFRTSTFSDISRAQMYTPSIAEVTLVEGEYSCRKCKSPKCYVSSSQDRRGDEGMITHVTCAICGNHHTV